MKFRVTLHSVQGNFTKTSTHAADSESSLMSAISRWPDVKNFPDTEISVEDITPEREPADNSLDIKQLLSEINTIDDD